MSRRRRRFRPTVGVLEPRIALSSSTGLSSFFSSIFPSLFGNSSSTSSKPTTHTLAYYEKLAPTNARAAQIVHNVEARREKAAELKAAHVAAHAAALAAHGHGHA
jgi:hypothetical protein